MQKAQGNPLRNFIMEISTAPTNPWTTIFADLTAHENDLSDPTVRAQIEGEIEALQPIADAEGGDFAIAFDKLCSDFQNFDAKQVVKDIDAVTAFNPPALSDYKTPLYYGLKNLLTMVNSSNIQQIENEIAGAIGGGDPQSGGTPTSGLMVFAYFLGNSVGNYLSLISQDFQTYELYPTPSNLALLMNNITSAMLALSNS